jgi:uncharacterized membrane protein
VEEDTIFTKLVPLLKSYWLPIVLAGLGLIFFIYGLMSLLDINQYRKAEQFSQ